MVRLHLLEASNLILEPDPAEGNHYQPPDCWLENRVASENTGIIHLCPNEWLYPNSR